MPTPAALPHPIAAAAAAARQANLRRPLNGFTYICLPPPNICLLAESASSLERPHEVTGSAYGLQPHQPVSDVRAVVSAAVVLTPPCGSQLAARISTTSGAVHLFREHLRAIAVRSAYGGTRQRVGVPRFLVANGALSKSSTPAQAIGKFHKGQSVLAMACERTEGARALREDTPRASRRQPMRREKELRCARSAMRAGAAQTR